MNNQGVAQSQIRAMPPTRVRVLGECDSASWRELRDRLVEACLNSSRVCLDLSAVTFFSAEGVTALIEAQLAARRAGCELVLGDASSAVRMVLDAAGLTGECALPPAPSARHVPTGWGSTDPRDLLAEQVFGRADRMLTPDDLTTLEQAEIVRRSVAMLNTGAWALNREEALLVLDRLVDLLRQQRAAVD